MAATGLLGVLGAYAIPSEAADRLGAFVGVGTSALTGAVALPLKRWALSRSIESTLKMVGWVFAVRAVVVTVGLLAVKARGAGTVAFVIGFFAVYFVMQWLEIGYVLAEQRRRGSGG